MNDLPPAVGLAAVAVLLAANGFFVAAEFAIVAVRRSRLETLAQNGNRTAGTAVHMVQHMNTFIAACQLGITIASLLLGWIGEPALAHLIEPPLVNLIGTFAAEAVAHAVATVVALTIVTSLHIIVGEQAPKGFALQKPEVTTLLIARPLQFFEFLFRWPTAALMNLTNGLLRLLGLEAATGHEQVHTVEELRLLVTGSREAGVVEASEARIATRAFSFADLSAGALMTPRTEVDALSVDLDMETLCTRVDASTHTRMPVYEESLDHIVGVLYVPDFYRALRQANQPNHALQPGQPGQSVQVGAGLGGAQRPFDLRAILRPPMVTPESKAADDLLDEMRATGRYYAVVIDEYGGTAGILTLEDLVEALVGPLRPELGSAAAAAEEAQLAVTADGSAVLDGLMRLEELEEAAGVRFDESDHEDVETVGGLFMARLGRIPVEGDEIAVSGRTLRVEALDGMRVALVRLLPAGGQDEMSSVGGTREASDRSTASSSPASHQ